MMKKSRAGFLAVLLATSLPTAAFASEMTVQELYEKAQAAQSGINAFCMDMTGEADVLLHMGAGEGASSMEATGTVDIAMQLSKEPFAMSMKGTMAGDAMGQAGVLDLEMYFVSNEDGTGSEYIHVNGMGEDSGWIVETVSEDLMQQMADSIQQSTTGDYTAFTELYGVDIEAFQEKLMEKSELKEGTVDVNGKTCLELNQQIPGEMFAELITAVMSSEAFQSQLSDAGETEALDSSTLDMTSMIVSTIFGCLNMDMTSDYDAETFLPVHAQLDLSESDFSSLMDMFGSMFMTGTETEGESAPELSLELPVLNLAYDYDFETPVEITVPAEALQAGEEQTESAAL